MISLKSKINVFTNQIEEMKELCSKIQTFLDGNKCRSFMLFKNEYDKMRHDSKSLPFLNVFNQFGNMEDDVSMEMDDAFSYRIQIVVIEKTDVDEKNENLELENVEVEVEGETSIHDLIESIDRSNTPVSMDSEHT